MPAEAVAAHLHAARQLLLDEATEISTTIAAATARRDAITEELASLPNLLAR